jgi:hypothetical protein
MEVAAIARNRQINTQIRSMHKYMNVVVAQGALNTNLGSHGKNQFITLHEKLPEHLVQMT